MRVHRRPRNGPRQRCAVKPMGNPMAAPDDVDNRDGRVFPHGTGTNGSATSPLMWGHLGTTE